VSRPVAVGGTQEGKGKKGEGSPEVVDGMGSKNKMKKPRRGTLGPGKIYYTAVLPGDWESCQHNSGGNWENGQKTGEKKGCSAD